MSLYYSIIFGILVAEVILFSILALPIPTKYRKPLTLVLIKPFKNPTVQVSIKCILCFILLLFLDSVNKVYNIETELNSEAAQGPDRIEFLSRKFLHQRNLYLTGMTLFLTFIVMRTFGLVNELLTLKDIYRSPKPNAVVEHEIKTKEEIVKLIEEKDAEIRRLKEKAEALQKQM